jgi:hypothetical protein
MRNAATGKTILSDAALLRVVTVVLDANVVSKSHCR